MPSPSETACTIKTLVTMGEDLVVVIDRFSNQHCHNRKPPSAVSSSMRTCARWRPLITLR